ncbi:RNA triphosphatase putative (CET1) [Leptomonas pyrrhocoris]|uniref:mRNA 5'-phosphatase n=1 Tax=Leptomonas pyrrhocoris TaxID=157538 RepID=A0A0M9G0H0_LEPPY|nr:RNA triphosphatase putative (CET1) [Leptomonas pyrrhocoris]KPA79733.1 RNA triphosphatase putative (CET1) [Leptomonas pyrrhocoris]|eukprot:XP_015658172.1 RNA triphosphatase putative (CET1) [Leptomonas pyrrhocoris]
MSSAASGEAKDRADASTPECTSAPPPTETASATAVSRNGGITQGILERLKPFLSEQHIEVEARLCHFSAPQLPSPSTGSDTAAPALHILSGSNGRIEVGVSADDFERMRTFVEAAKKLPTQHTKTEDVITRSGRYTYAMAEDGSERFVGCISKKRLCNVEVHVPGCPYDIRLSVSTEVPRERREAPAVKPKGFVRQKSRWTATEGTYEYAFTRVGGPADKKATFEVEIEGVHANAQEGVTVAWLEELMDRLLAMARLAGNTGLPRNTARTPGEKRQR